MTGDATRPTPEGYLVCIVCVCGEWFERWVTPEAAEEEIDQWLRHTMN